MRLKEFYNDENEDDVESINVKVDKTVSIKSTLEQQIEARERIKIWFPPSGRLIYWNDKGSSINKISYKTKGNISQQEREALKDLMNDGDIFY